MEKTDNELINAFMGLKSREIRNGGFPFTAWYREGDYENWFSQPEYEKDWNALMPVVEKIGTMYDPEYEDGKYYHVDFAQSLFDLPIGTPITEVRKEVVNAIHWYNSNKKA